jgi:hypothetical protein
VANANANAVRVVAAAMETEGGMNAANLRVAQQYVEAFANLAKTSNTLIIPSNVSDVAGVVASAMTVLDRAKSARGGNERLSPRAPLLRR